MPLESGRQLGPYEIIAPLGAGGMGEVYKARDTRLDRTVAIKVLPAHLSARPDLKQRFEREARAASSLNHPNICTLHDIGHQEGTDFLVLEYLEGETLATRLERGPQPRDESLRIAAQIADALDKAHRQGLIHRDLKPGNIMLTRNGAKLLDFGLAKSTSVAGAAAPMTAAPTMTSPLTAEGAIVGTFQYMAPEQLEGAEATARSDIFAFGVVLYEMVSGRRPFGGKTQASLVAAILKETPPSIATVQPPVPPTLERLIGTCLEKDPEERRQSMHDVLLELRWIAAGDPRTASPSPGSLPARPGRAGRERLAWLLATAGFLAAAAMLLLQIIGPRKETPLPVHAALLPPEASAFDYQAGPMSVSPDGTMIAFVARSENGTPALWVRDLDRAEARLLQGTTDASMPFWSPDDGSIAYFAPGKLMRISAAGGAPDAICDSSDGFGGTWNREGIIVFNPGWGSGLMRVSAAGGKPSPVTRLDPGDFVHRHPDFLPDGEHFLFSVRSGESDANALMVGSLDGAAPQHLLTMSSSAVFMLPGSILYWRDGALRAQAFDPDRLELKGDPVVVVHGVRFEPNDGRALFSASAGGVLAYHGGEGATSKSRLVLRGRDGAELGTVGPPGNYYSPALSPDGRRVAVDNSGVENNGDLWVYDLDRPTATRLTFDPADESCPVWSPGGDRLAICSWTRGAASIQILDLTGRVEQRPLVDTEASEEPSDWSRDDRWLVYERRESTAAEEQGDIWIVSLADGTTRPFVASPFREEHGKVSPDGRWLAYTSYESGRPEVYVQPFPDGGRKWQVSTDGGAGPRWRGDGGELYYTAPDDTLMAVAIAADPDLQAKPPVALFPSNIRFSMSAHFDAADDGRRFLINEVLFDESRQPMSLILNWDAALGIDRP